MGNRGEPLYKSRPHAPEAARFGRCERINDFICMSEGNSNSYLIETSEGNVLVNTGMGFEAPVHEKNYQDLLGQSDLSIRYIIFTQGHVDHVGGTRYFRENNPLAEVVATADNPEHQQYDARLQSFRSSRSAFRFLDSFTQLFRYYADSGYKDFPAQDRPEIDIGFDDEFSFVLGGLEIICMAQPGAETNDSLIIWLPEQSICLTGNLFGCPFGHFPNLVTIRGDRYRDALVCAAAAQRVLELHPDIILYGHHAPVTGADVIKREVSAFRDATLYVHDETVAGMNAGKSVYTLMNEIALPPEFEVGQGYGKVAWGVRAIWEHYAGWFHHSSTTELYSVPTSVISSDLVELAGPDALVQRARERFTDREPEAALHLLDVVLQVCPDHDSAKQLSVVVHKSLLEDARTFCVTGNFWLEGWLEHQLKILGGDTAGSLSEIIR